MVERGGSRYNVVVNAITSDERIGSSHTKVPGYDGKKGFGGACLPKDTAAIANYGDGILTVLEEVIRQNNAYRSHYEQDDREKEQKIRYN